MKRILALILSILLTVSSVPGECFAAELEEEEAVSAVENMEVPEETAAEVQAAEETAPAVQELPLPAGSPRSGGLTEQEPNDSREKANIIRDGETISGVMFTDIPSLNLDHADFFKFTVTENCTAFIDVIASKKSLFFLVTDSSENLIGEAYSAAFLGKYMYWCYADVVPGTYYIWLGDSDMDYLTYEISLELRGCDHSRNTGVVTAPTCGEQGYTTYTCSDCGETWTDDYTAATGEHSYRDTVTAPTCGNRGYTTHTCTHCGHTQQDSYTEPTGKHVYSTKVTAPTCRDQGYTTYTCDTCGDSWNYNYVEATGEHTIGSSSVVAPDCIHQGYTLNTCTHCGEEWKSHITDPTGVHAPEAQEIIAPTCVEPGYTVYACAVCGYTWNGDPTEATGEHTDVVKVVTAPTCLTPGHTDYTCRECGTQWVDDPTEALNHANHTCVVTAPTCLEPGYTTYTCTDCGYSWEADPTKATNHRNRTGTVKKPTCLEPGYSAYTCLDCGYSWQEDSTAVSESHVYSTEQDMDCDLCGHVRTLGTASGFRADGLWWILWEEGTLQLGGTGAIEETAPWNEYRDQIQSIVIGEGITAIAAEAFAGFAGLKSVTVGPDVAAIGDLAFHNCPGLERLTVDKANEAYASDTSGILYDKKKTLLIRVPQTLSGEYSIPDTVKTVETLAFSGCTGLTEVTFGAAVKEIGSHAFENCSALTRLAFTGNVPAVAPDAFAGISAEAAYPARNANWVDANFPNGGAALSWSPVCLGSHGPIVEQLVKPTCIAMGYTHYSCGSCGAEWENNYTDVTDEHLFYGWDEPCELCGKERSQEAWGFCGQDVRWGLDDRGTLMIAGEGDMSFQGSDSPWQEYRQSIRNVVIKQGVTSIAPHAFNSCTELTSVTLPDGLIRIGGWAFFGCEQLTSIIIPDSVTTIGMRAFNWCPKLSRVTLPENLTEISEDLFSWCRLSVITIPKNVTTIHSGAFAYNKDTGGILYVYFSGDPPVIESNPFSGNRAIGYYPRDNDSWTQSVRENYGSVFHSWSPFCNGNHQLVTQKAVEPTCTRAGSTEKLYCTACKTTIDYGETIPAFGHTMMDIAGRAPTCTMAGTKGYSQCVVCGYQDVNFATQSIPATGHTPVKDPSKAPTCTQTGLTEGSHCSVCAEILTAQEELPMLAHTEKQGKDKAPTCTENGLSGGSFCSVCKAVLTPHEIIPALGHSEAVDAGVEATCTAPGLTQGSHCTVCGKILIPRQEIPALGHSEAVDPEKMPTCTETGLTEGSHCSTCCQVLVPQVKTPTKGHTPVTDAYVAATCAATGLTEGSHCEVCGEILSPQQELPLAEHKEVEDPYQAPGCEDGYTQGSHCAVCGQVLIPREVIPGKGHNEILDAAVEATCTSDGLTEGSHCDICGETVVAQQVIPALSHRYQVSGTAAVCSDCGKTVALELQQYLALDLQLVKTAQLHQPEAMSLSWQIEEGGEAVAKVDETGLVTALGAGTAWVIASCKVDENTALTARCRVDVTENPQTERIALGSRKLTVELFSREYASLPVLLDLPQNRRTPISGSAAIESACFAQEELNRWFTLVPLDDRTLAVVPTAEATEEPKAVPKKATGTILLTVDGQQLVSEELTVTVKQTKPKLKATVASFNSFYSGQAQALQITGGTVTGIREKTLPDWLKLEGEALILTEAAPLKNTSGKVTLLVDTEEWAIPAEITLTAKNSYKAPGIKLSASTVTFTKEAEASRGIALQLLPSSKKDSLSSLKVTGVTAENGYAVENWNSADGTFVLKAPEGAAPGKTKLTVHFADTETLLTLNLTVKTAAVKLKLDKTSITLNNAMGDSAAVTVTATPADLLPDLTEQDLRLTDSRGREVALSTLQIEAKENRITLKPACGTGSYKLYVSYGGSKEAVLKIKVISGEASVSFKAKGNLDPSFPSRALTVTPAFKNYMGQFTVANVTAKGNAGGYFRLTQEGQALLVHCEADTPAGTYSLGVKLLLGNGRTCENTLKVTVKPTAVKLKLSTAKLTLNKAIGEAGFVDVSCTTKGYVLGTPVTKLMDKSGKKSAAGELDVSYADGRLTVAVNDNTDYGTTYKLLVRANDTAPAQTLTVTVPTEAKSAVTASLKLTGKLDVIRPGSFVTVTPGYKNCLSTTEKTEQLRILCAGEDVTHLFVITPNGKGGYSIARAKGAALKSGEAYKAELVSTLGGTELAAVTATFKPVMGSAKVSLEAENTSLFSQDKQDRTVFRVLPKDAALSEAVRVEIKDAKYRDVFQVYSYGNGEFALGFRDSQVPEKLIGKTVTVNLNIFLECNQTQKANASAKLKLTVLK